MDLSDDAWTLSDNSAESLILPADGSLQPAAEIQEPQGKANTPVLRVRRRSQASGSGSGSIANSINASTASISIKSTPALALTTDHHVQAPKEPATPNSAYLNNVLSSLSKEDDASASPPSTSPTMMSYRKTPRSKRNVSSVSSVDIKSPLAEAQSFTYDINLYVEEKFHDTDIHYATIPRNEEFHKLFKSVAVEDRLLDDFSCALSRDILLQGRIYVSEHNICFNSNLLGWVTNLVIPFNDIEKFEKTTTVGLFPNGIAIVSKEGRNSFVSFISRDIVFNFLEKVWHASGGNINNDSKQDYGSLLKITGIPVVSKGMDLTQDTIYTAYGGALMSLDSDSPRKSPPSGDDSDSSDSETSEVKEPNLSNQTVYSLKEGSEYTYEGPHGHSLTRCPYSPLDNNETILTETNFKCAPGVLYGFLFGENTKLTLHFLKSQGSKDVTEISGYDQNSEGKKERHYEYIKALNYSVGPKQTKCVVQETIEHFDLNGYINVVNTTRTPDVPSGGSFCVKTRYIMTWGKGNTSDLTVSYLVEWTASSWIKGVIEKSTKSGLEDATKTLVLMISDVLNENIETGSEEVTDGNVQEIEEVAPITAVIERPTKVVSTVSITDQFSTFNVFVIVLLSIILLLQFSILYGLRRTPVNRLSFANFPSLDQDSEDFLVKGEESLIWTWLDERSHAMNESRRGELKVLQSEIDKMISQWTSGELKVKESQTLLKLFGERLNDYVGNVMVEDEKHTKVRALKEALSALL